MITKPRKAGLSEDQVTLNAVPRQGGTGKQVVQEFKNCLTCR